MFDTPSQHSSARKAAFAVLKDAVSCDSPSKSVKGTHLGLEVTFLDQIHGWEIRVKGIESLPALEIVYTGNESSNGDFTDLYELDGTPGSLDVLASSDFHNRIMAVLPKRITMSEGRLVLTKTYVLYTAEAKKIGDAITLGVDLLIAAQRTSKPHATQLTGGAPYRQESVALVSNSESELAAFRSRQRARGAIRFSHVLLTLALVFFGQWGFSFGPRDAVDVRNLPWTQNLHSRVPGHPCLFNQRLTWNVRMVLPCLD